MDSGSGEMQIVSSRISAEVLANIVTRDTFQHFENHSQETDQVRLTQIRERAEEDAKWVLAKVCSVLFLVAVFVLLMIRCKFVIMCQ